MLGIHDLPLFIVSSLLLNATPGADTLLIVTRSLGQGRRAGAAAALGINAGCVVHVFAATLGLSALLQVSALAFTAVKLLGAAYLVYLGVSLMRTPRAVLPPLGAGPQPASVSLKGVFWQGFLTNVLNPKVALFFLAFVPQFIEPTAPSKPLAFLLLGVVFVFNSTWWCLLLAHLAARAGGLRVGERAAAWLRRGVGAVFVLLGLKLALAARG